MQPYVVGIEGQLADLWVLLIAGTVLMLVGLVDDIRGLSWRFRLIQSGSNDLRRFCENGTSPPCSPSNYYGWLYRVLDRHVDQLFNAARQYDAAAGGVAVICSSLWSFMLCC